MRRTSTALALAALTALACSSQTPDAAEPTAAPDSGGPKKAGSSIGISAEIGALNEGKVKAAFNGSIDGMFKCFKKGLDRLEYLSGTIKVGVRVPLEGTIRVYMKASTLGDRQVEACMLDVVRAKDWPRPEGGKEGLAESEFTFDPVEGTRAPVEWSPSDAGKNVEKVRAALRSCKKGSGSASATLYVETDGTVKAVGVAGQDASIEEAADCVVRAAKDLKLNSPGSFAAKLTVSE
ncbi:MAG: hypothetical protein IPG04_07450 [Polyangiaceae bacterium]|jgi:hypothetical protein|nr:hypothetical protein [Polyangiaceae bacterium]